MKNIVIMISGRGSNMEAILKNARTGVLKDVCMVKSVFSNNIEAKGIEIAKAMGVPTKIISSKHKMRKVYNKLVLDYLKEVNPDFIVLAGYMKIIPKSIITQFKGKIINIHPADTALHQGLNGYKWAFNNKLKSTKVTVHFVDEGLDTGKVIDKAEINLTGVSTLEDVEKRGLVVEHKFYSKCLRKIFM